MIQERYGRHNVGCPVLTAPPYDCGVVKSFLSVHYFLDNYVFIDIDDHLIILVKKMHDNSGAFHKRAGTRVLSGELDVTESWSRVEGIRYGKND